VPGVRRVLLAAAVVACAAAGTAATPARAASWCGTDVSASDRLPEAVAGRQVHVVYAFPSDGADRFATYAGAIVSDATAIDAWWRSQDPTRAPRFDLFSFPGCPPGLGELDISRVQLPNNTAWYQPFDTRFSRLATDLAAPPSALSDSDKKYLVFYDGPVDQPRVCGFSPVLPFAGGAGADSFIFLGSACPQDLGSGSFIAAAAAHELTHNLGALNFNGPPHACPGDPGHPCDSDHDLMFPFLRFPLPELVLDFGHDDYYAHPGSWFDVQDSDWLAHVADPQFSLTVTIAGSGAGTVAGNHPGISCPPACSIAWDSGSGVTLAATAGPRTRFVGWSGACTGAADCVLTRDAAKAVTARFALQVALTVRVRGAGTVTSTPRGIACPSTCTNGFDQGAAVRLTAKPKRGSKFTGWTGACTGKGACTVRLARSRTVSAQFRPKG
jgi:hypothetical protein